MLDDSYTYFLEKPVGTRKLLTDPKKITVDLDFVVNSEINNNSNKIRDIYLNNKPLFFANSDQFVEWDSNEFLYKMNETEADGGIVTFEATHPKWSFAKIDEKGLVTEVAEKKPISNIATVGFYYWKHGSDFVKYAEQMIDNEIRVNNEFYVCPVFNEAIKDCKAIRTFNVDGMWGLGTPEDLNYYLENYKS